MIRIAALLLLVASSGTASSQTSDSGQEFIRYRKGKAVKRLETAAVTYALGAAPGSVTLVASAHVGDPEYYAALQEDLADYDVVLFEGVLDEDGKPVDDFSTLLARLQKALGDYLGLARQQDALDVGAANFVHADLSASQVSSMLDARGVELTPFGDVLEKLGPWVSLALRMLDGVTEDENGEGASGILDRFRPRLKALTADLLGNGVELYERVKRPEDRLRDEVIVQARNGYVFEQIEKHLAAQPDARIAVVYGAAHMPDFEVRIKRSLDGVVDSVQWHSAWNLMRESESSEERKTRRTRKL